MDRRQGVDGQGMFALDGKQLVAVVREPSLEERTGLVGQSIRFPGRSLCPASGVFNAMTLSRGLPALAITN